MNLADSITSQIEKEKIEPIASWKFHVRYALFWLLFCIAVVIGALAFSLILYFFLEADFGHSPSPFVHIVQTLPVIWITSFVLFFALGYWGLKHTPKGYKVPLWIFCISNICITLCVGFGLYAFDIPEDIDKATQSIPFMRGLENRQEELWSQSEKGLLGGTVVSATSDSLVLEDFNGGVWNVLLSEEIQEKGEKMQPPKRGNTQPPSIEQLMQGKKVKLKGEVTQPQTFYAEEMLPWRKGSFKPCRRDNCRKPFGE